MQTKCGPFLKLPVEIFPLIHPPTRVHPAEMKPGKFTPQ